MTEGSSEHKENSCGSDEVSLEDKKNVSPIMRVAAWFIPFLWPFAIESTIAIFQKTSKKIGIAALSLAGVAVLAVVVNGCSQSNELDNSQESASENQIPDKPLSASAHLDSNAKGKQFADRLESECDYWGIDKYNPDGTVTISKSIYTSWGGRQVMMIPRGSWNVLSSTERSDLASYVSQKKGFRVL